MDRPSLAVAFKGVGGGLFGVEGRVPFASPLDTSFFFSSFFPFPRWFSRPHIA